MVGRQVFIVIFPHSYISIRILWSILKDFKLWPDGSGSWSIVPYTKNITGSIPGWSMYGGN